MADNENPDVAELLKALEDEKAKSGKLKESLNNLDSKLKSLESQKAEEIEEARKEALEKWKKEGKAEEILADAEKRIGETKAQYEERLGKLESQLKSRSRGEYLANLAADLGILPEARAKFDRLISSRIDVDLESGKRVYLDDDGRATSLSDEDFKKELEGDAAIKFWRKAEVSGGGAANGSSGGGSASKSGSVGGSKQDRIAHFKERFPDLN